MGEVENNNKLARNFTFMGLFLIGVPSLLLQLWTGIYQIFDTSIATAYNSANALSAINIIYPAQAIIEAVAFLISSGSTAVIAKLMGEKKDRQANQLLSFMIVLSIILSVIWIVLVTIGGERVWLLLGANDKLAPICAEYWSVHKFFMPLYMIQLGFQMWLLAAGKPTYCMIITIAGGVVTLGTDILYQGVLHLGIKGAALGFGTGVAFGAILSVIAVISRKNALHLDRPHASGADVGECIKIGIADFIYSAATAAMTAVYNIQAMKYYGEDGVAVAAIYLYAQFLFLAPFLGFGKGVGPVFSYKYGEENWEQIKDLFKKYCKWVVVLLVVFGGGALILAGPVLSIYVKPGDPVYELGHQKWIMFALCFIFCGINLTIQSMFTAFNDTFRPLVISALRACILPIVCLIILPAVMGGNGIWLSLTAAEIITAVVSVFFLMTGKKKFHYA